METNIIVQWITENEQDPNAPLTELRTLQILRSKESLDAVEQRKQWTSRKFGKAKGSTERGVVMIPKEDVVIESPDFLGEYASDDIIVQRAAQNKKEKDKVKEKKAGAF